MKKLCTLLLSLSSITALAQDMRVDSSYGTYGYSDGECGGSIHAFAEQPDGKIVVGGAAGSMDMFSIFRFYPDGTFDTAFGYSGEAKLFVGSASAIEDITVQSDSKVLVSGQSTYCTGGLCGFHNMAIVRFKTNGMVDSSFSADGIVRAEDFFPIEWDVHYSDARRIKLQADGKVLALVYAEHVGGTIIPHSLVSRLNTDGSLDNTFASSGYAIFTGMVDQPLDWYVDTDGSIFVLGNHGYTTGDSAYTYYSDIRVIKLNADGSVDSSFGTDGFAAMHYDNWTEGIQITKRADGKLVVLGDLDSVATGPFLATITVLNADGTVATDIPGGYATVAMPGLDINYISSLIVQPDNKMVISGYAMTYDYNTQAYIGRLNTDGNYDNTFKGTGYQLFDYGLHATFESGTFFMAMHTLSTGKILAAGAINQTSGSTAQNMFLMRITSGADTTTSVPLVNGAMNVSLYPNPATDVATLSYTPGNATRVTLQLQDMNGRTVHTYLQDAARNTGTQHECITRPAALPSGMYLLRMTTSDGEQITKSIVFEGDK